MESTPRPWWRWGARGYIAFTQPSSHVLGLRGLGELLGLVRPSPLRSDSFLSARVCPAVLKAWARRRISAAVRGKEKVMPSRPPVMMRCTSLTS